MKFKQLAKKCAVGVMALAICVTGMPMLNRSNRISAAEGSLGLNIVEQLGRGISAVNTGSGMLVSWRYLANDTDNTVFKLYRNGTLIYTSNIGEATCYLDANGKATDKYTVESEVNGVSVDKEECKLISDTDYLQINLTPPTASDCTYSPNDCSVGDADGDGEYEIFLKWDPSNSQDNSKSGVTGNVFIDCYKLDGTRLWRIDLGPNIRAGAHYTQFLVADFDCDGYAEMTCKTSDGTVDGKGNVIGDASKRYANSSGYILTGNEYYTLFDGRTGEALDTVNYNPGRGTVSKWGDSYGNRVDRFLGTVAYLDGVHPSAVTMRGYYTRMTACAYDVVDKKLVERWFFDTGNSSSTLGYGDGNHNCMPADVDGDSRQEIITGNTCIDDDGKLKWCLNMGHGDAMHVGDLLPDRAGLEVWICHEDSPYGVTLIDASKGTKIFHVDGSKDTGRCCADNVWSGNPGAEFWGLGNNVYDGNGNLLSCKRPAINFLCYWDGDLEREILDGYTDTAATISKMNANGTISTLKTTDGYYTCNTTKGTPCLSADIFGDWREEVIVRASDSKSIRIYCTTYDTDYRITTLMHDSQYRNQVSAQQTAYNQPPHASFYLGSDASLPSRPNVTVRGISTESDVTGDYFNHFAGQKNNNTLYTITGNYSNSKGTVTYAGESYSECLKMESATNVSFSTTSEGTLTLVFAEVSNTGAAKVDGTTYASDANGVVTVALPAGSHTITKANSTNLFIINFEASGSTEEHTHTWDAGTVTTPATCIATGTRTYTCSGCSETKTEIIAKTAHNYSSEWTVDVPATETTAGSESRHCTTAGCTATTDSRVIPATGSSETTPSVTISFDATTLTANNGDSVTATTFGNGYIKVTGNTLVYKTTKVDNVYTTNVSGIAVPSSGTAGLTVKVNGTATLVVTASSSGSAKTSSISVVSATGATVAEKNGETSVTGGSTSKKDFTYELAAGEYTVVCPTDSATSELRVIAITGTGNYVAYEASQEPEAEKKNGLCKNDEDGLWYYYTDDVVDTTKTGLVQGSDSVFWYVNAGVVDTSYTGFITNGAGTWYVISGKLDVTFTGLGQDGDNFIAVFDGKAYPSFTGLIQNAGYFWYVNAGVVDTTYTGFYENSSGKWYVANSKVDTSFKGLGQDGDKWLVVLGGKHDSTYTGLIKNGGAFWYVNNGVLDTTFTGITQTGGASWLVATGKLRDDYTGTYTDGTQTYTIVNGKVTQ